MWNLPGKTACFDCLELEFIKDFGKDLYHEIVDGLQFRMFGRFPSFVTGPIQTATIMADEIFAFLTNLWPNRTIDSYVLMEGIACSEKKSLHVNKICPTCSEKEASNYANI